MIERPNLMEFLEKLPAILRVHAWAAMGISVLWLMLQGRTRAWLMSSMVVIGGIALAKLNDVLPTTLSPDDSREKLPSLIVFAISMYCKWVVLLIWFRISLTLVGWETSHQNPIPLLLLCYALSAAPLPWAGLGQFPLLEIGAHLSIFLSLLLIISADNMLVLANVLFFLVGTAALMLTVRDLRGRAEE